MDPFDDILPVAPAARARPGGKFMPKAKSKQLPQKEISATNNATPSKDEKNKQVSSSSANMAAEAISQNECHNTVVSTLTMSAEESMSPHLKGATNSEMDNLQEVSVSGDTTALADTPPSMIMASEVDVDWNDTNLPKSACEADSVGFEVGPDTNFMPKTNLNDGATQPVQPDNTVENVLSKVAASSTTCSTIDTIEESPKKGEGSFLDSNKHLELIDNSLEVGPDLTFKKSASDDKVAVFESNIHSSFNIGREREVESVEFELDPFSNVLPDPGARNANKFLPKIKPRPKVGAKPAIAPASSNVMMEKSANLPTCTNEVQSFKPSGDACSGLNQSTSLPLPTTDTIRTTDLPMSSSIPFSEDDGSLEAVNPSQVDSPNARLSKVADDNETRDWPSSFGKSTGETADIFSELESLDDFLTQAATDTGKPALQSFNEKGAEENFVIPACSSVNSFEVCDTTQVQKCVEHHTTQDSLTFNEAAVLNEDDTCTNNRRLETEEVLDLNPSCPADDVFDYQSMKSGADPTSEIPVHDELTNAGDSPTLNDLSQADVIGVKEDANERKKDGSLRKHKRSITNEEDKGGKTSRQLRKQAPRNNMVNEDVEDDDDLDPPYNPNRGELIEDDDEFEVDHSSKKQRASTSSKTKSVAKNGKTSQKRKKSSEDLEKTSKQPKKFSHSTQRRKRCVDKALLETPEDELDPQTLPIKDIILLAEYRERLAKKEASTSKTSSTNQSGGDFGHEADANNEEENLGSEDDRDPDDDQASERITSTESLFNYQSFMDKAPRGKWSKQDTELFYEAIRQFGTDFSMIQQLFPDRTRHQIKLKYKKEERQHPLRLSDAVNNRAKDHSHFKLVIERLKQASTKPEQDPSKDASDFTTGEEVEDLPPETNDEVAAANEDANVKDREDSAAVHSPEQSYDSDDDLQRWAQYKSDY